MIKLILVGLSLGAAVQFGAMGAMYAIYGVTTLAEKAQERKLRREENGTLPWHKRFVQRIRKKETADA